MSRSGTLVVPTRQRAAALSAAYAAAMLSAGRQVWESPDILSFSAWIDRELSATRARHEDFPRRLSSTSAWMLWREAVNAAASGLALLAPELLIDSVRRASQLLEDYGIELRGAGSPESALLLKARLYHRRRCSELGVIDGSSWRACSRWLRPSARLWLAGFGGSLGSALGRWLSEHGAVIPDIEIAAGERADDGVTAGCRRVAAFPETTQEAQAAADWCAALLEREPCARLLLVVPRLHEQRHVWQRALSYSLDCAAILQPQELLGSSPPYCIEGGEPLTAHPLVAAALNALAIASGEAEFDQLSALLRSHFFALLKRPDALRLELWLREHNVDSGRLAPLLDLLPAITRDLGLEAAQTLRQLAQAFEDSSRLPAAAASGKAPREHWARALAALLAQLGWPGDGPAADAALQARQRFDELLGEFAGAEPAAEALSLSDASALLHRLAARLHVEEPSADAAVTVTANLDDPIVYYDGLWVAGLSTTTWPPAARPDALIPFALQQAAGIPAASSKGQLRRAQSLQRQWFRAGSECVLSWARSEGELPQDMSPLLRDVGAPAASSAAPAAAAATAAAVAVGFNIERWLGTLAPPLETWADSRGPQWSTARALRGGARLLELQSLCPFRAFAELRLGARSLGRPAPGIELHQRGRIVHRALELFWSATGDLATLQEREERESRRLAQQCAQRAVAEIAMAVPPSLQSVLLARERERTAEMIEQLIAWERTRAPFITRELEATHALEVAGASLRVRLDRVDRLADGRLLVIDYKSGRSRKFDPHEVRPQQPQLPAYALVAGEPVAALLAVYVGRDGVELQGIADQSDRVPGLKAAAASQAEWLTLQRRWSECVHDLVQEFLDGHAAVTPQLHACDRCHLQPMCRIEPSGLLELDAEGAATAQRAEIVP